MGILGIFEKRKKAAQEYQEKQARLLKLQKLSFINSPDRLVFSEEQIMNATNNLIQNDLRIIEDCKNIVMSTIKPDTFFSRLDLLVQKAEHLCKFEGLIQFAGALPSEALKEVNNEYQIAVKMFLIRYYTNTFEKAQAMKTDKGRINQYVKFYDSLQSYYPLMNDENKEYIETKYHLHQSEYEKQ